MANPGEMVLFRLGASCQRPLLVVSADGHVVSGEVFVDWDLDRTEDWFTKGFSMPPDPSRRQIEVRGVQEGPGIGQWTRAFNHAPAVDAAEIVEAAEAAREGLMPAQEATPPQQQGPPAPPNPLVGQTSHLIPPDPTAPAITNRPPLQKITVGRSRAPKPGTGQ